MVLETRSSHRNSGLITKGLGAALTHILETGNDSFRFKASTTNVKRRKEKIVS